MQPVLDVDMEGDPPRSPESAIDSQTHPTNASEPHVSTRRSSKETPRIEDSDLSMGAIQSSPKLTSRIENTAVVGVKGEGEELPEIKTQGTVSTALSSYEG
jgi:hypothetical protein